MELKQDSILAFSKKASDDSRFVQTLLRGDNWMLLAHRP